jgi:hypothetical protein
MAMYIPSFGKFQSLELGFPPGVIIVIDINRLENKIC